MSDIEELEVSLDYVKSLVEKRDQALKLTSNREYKKLVLEGYFKEEASRLALLTADPSLRPEMREDVFLSLQGISKMNEYMRYIIIQGNQAESELKEYEEALDEAREEAA